MNGAGHSSPDQRWKVLCLWDISQCPEVLDALKAIADVDLMPPEFESVAAVISNYDAVLVALQLPLDAELISHAGKLKIVVTPSTGLDHIDQVALNAAGVELQSIKTEYDLLEKISATAELAWALLLAVARKIPSAHAAATQADWARDRLRGTQLSGKTLGIVGAGRLGSMVARYGLAFGMRVIACDPAPRKPVADIEYVSMRQLLDEAHAISLHVHLNDQTRHLIDAQCFAAMRPGAILINTSRGGLVDEAALVASIKSGKLGGAGLDVIDGEWLEDLSVHPVIKAARQHSNIVLTPHIGGVTHDSQRMVFEFCAKRLARTISAV